MAGVLLLSTFLFYLLILCPVFQCLEDSNFTTFEQDFWEMEVDYDMWLRIGCIMDSPPSGRFQATLSSENGTVLIKAERLIYSSTAQLFVYDYTTKNSKLFAKNELVPSQPLPDGTSLHYMAVKLNGSHFIATDLNGWEIAIRTALHPSDIWNVNLNAFGRAILTCIPRIDCRR